MKTISLTVQNETGLHSRPADLFVRTAKLFDSDIQIEKSEKRANGKSILKVILLNVCQGDEIKISAEGADEETALQELRELIVSDFEKINPAVSI